MAAPVDLLCMACQDDTCDFKPLKVQRRPVGDEDVLIDMKYCGVCHTDLHIAANHTQGLQKTLYPCVPGHELAGVCTQVGSKVTKIKVGDHVGVGCMVDSCLNCVACQKGDENMCRKQNTATYQGDDKHGRAATYPVGGKTIGGYSTKMVVHERFAILIPKSYPLECAGPIMCAGITMYEPLKVYKAKAGSKVGIVGLGGLGLTGIKIAKALGCSVTAISRGEGKRAMAAQCGADSYIASSSSEQMAAGAKSFDLILDTIPSYHDIKPYQRLVTEEGKLVILGLSSLLLAGLAVDALTGGRSTVTASGIGGIANTQEVINLCDKHKILPPVKVCPVHELNRIYELLDSTNDAGLRYVLDLEGSLNESTLEKCTLPPPKLGTPVANPTLGGIVSDCFSMLSLHWGCAGL